MPQHTPSTYDEMPYINAAFPQSHPDRLATLAKLFGMKPPSLDACRVLELGCASGDNLIPMALGMPAATFLGIDLSARQIEQGERMVKTLGLNNIELRHANIADVDASYGQFDYIVCHGIYSWVPEPIREKIFAICRENLVQEGVAYVSYNTLPGWRIRGMIRDMMVYQSAMVEGASAKVQQARALLDFLVQSVPEGTPYAMTLKQELDLIRDQADAYLFHDHLEVVNEPVYFHQFAESARRHRLEYLAEADFSGMLVSNFPAEVAKTLRRIATDIIRMEQFMDFVRNRTFRQTLLVHEGTAIRRNLDWQALKGFHVTSPAQPASANVSLAPGASEAFRARNGATLNTSSPLTKTALVLLVERWPLGMRFEELVQAARTRLAETFAVTPDIAAFEKDVKSLGGDLLQCYAVDVIELHMRPPRLCLTPSGRPTASPLARLQAERDVRVTNLRHEPMMLDGFTRRLLPLLDGTRDHDALIAALVSIAGEGKLEVKDQNSGEVLTKGPVLEQVLRKALEASLPPLAKAALLVE